MARRPLRPVGQSLLWAACRSFSERGLRATQSSAFVSGYPVRERGELHFVECAAAGIASPAGVAASSALASDTKSLK